MHVQYILINKKCQFIVVLLLSVYHLIYKYKKFVRKPIRCFFLLFVFLFGNEPPKKKVYDEIKSNNGFFPTLIDLSHIYKRAVIGMI